MNEEFDSLPSSRAQAKAEGAIHYYTGTPCKNGHTDRRQTSTGQCSECCRAWALKWYGANKSRSQEISNEWKKENADRVRSYRAKWRNENIEHVRKRKSEAAKKFRKENPEEARTRARSRRLRNIERERARSREKDKKNPIGKATRERNRRARKASAEGFHTAGDVARIRKAQRDKCAACGVGMKCGGHVDHIVALSRGGSNWPRNLQLLCEHCNLSKHTRDQIDFMRSRGRLL